MNIEEIALHKKQLELAIQVALVEFREATGTLDFEIAVKLAHVYNAEGILTDIECDVEAKLVI